MFSCITIFVSSGGGIEKTFHKLGRMISARHSSTKYDGGPLSVSLQGSRRDGILISLPATHYSIPSINETDVISNKSHQVVFVAIHGA